MRVLMAAFACRPGHGSEPEVGWAVVRGALMAGHTVVLVTQPRNREAVESLRRSDPEARTRLSAHYVGLPASFMEAWERRAGLRGLQLYNLVWQGLLARTARRLQSERPFDVAHHVTLSTDWVPTGLAGLAGVPLVWGPLGGAERVPATCRRWLGWRGRLTEVVRAATADRLRAGPAARAARRAALLVAQNGEEAAHLSRARRPIVVRPNVFLADAADGAHAGRWASPESNRASDGQVGPVAVMAGRLLAWKGVHLALAVMARPEVRHWRLDVYGDGPQRRAMQRRIVREGLGNRVVLHGRRPRAQVRSAMGSADALLCPSLREAAGWTVAEALWDGCPVVCVAVGGPPLLVRGTGRAVPPGPDLVADMAAALASVEGAERAVVRWSAFDAPVEVDGWYRAAVAGTSGSLRRHPTAAVGP